MQDHYYQSSYPSNAALWVQGSIDVRFHVGDQTLWSMIYCDNQYYQSRRFFFNLGKRHIDMIVGRQRQNRKSTVVVPTQGDSDDFCDDWNKVLKWSEDRDGFQEYFSEAFEGGVITGANLLHLYPDYTRDPVSGDLCTDRVFYNNYLIDPYTRKMGFEDCQFIWRRRWVYKSAAIALLPGHAKQIQKMRPSGMKDGRFPLQAELLNLDTNRLFALDEFHYRTTREATMIIDPKTGESSEWEEDEEDSPDMLKRVMQMQPWLMVKKIQVPTVKLVITLGGHVFYHGKTQLGIDSYPFVPLYCYHFPDIQSYMWRLMGVWRNLRDAQFLYNMRRIIELDILQSQINSGWLYQIDSIVDPKAFRQSGQGFLVPVKAGKNINEACQRIEAPSIPQSMIELSRNLAEDITKISGVNEELLGAATDDKAGILAMLRQGAGLTTLQSIFDRADYSQRLYGKIRMEAIRKNFSKSKITHILGREPHPQFFSAMAAKYNLAVEEGNYSTTQRQMELQQLLHFKELGMPISNKSIMDAAFITNKRKILEDMQQAEQQQAQMQQAQMQSENEKSRADIMQKYAKTRSDLAKEKELMASAQEKTAKIVDIQATAEHKKAQSDMDLVKMMIELEDMDLAQLRSSFELAEAIKQANQPQPASI
ncbi:MAG TPA: hypothetical protein DCP92_24600 [Nitrospiraceae bacterium]|nr:hypothetical protein [Nitrospiraceae bacterium]